MALADLSARAQEREIDGVVYKAWPIPMKPHGTAALVRLIKVASPVLSGVLRAADGGGKSAAGAALFEALPTVLTEADVDYFAKAFGDASSFLNDAGDWAPLVEKVQGTHFAGRYYAFFLWIAFCAEVNYGGFFDGIRSAMAAGAPRPAAAK